MYFLFHSFINLGVASELNCPMVDCVLDIHAHSMKHNVTCIFECKQISASGYNLIYE